MDRTCLVTGATSGIGQETALGLARAGARVLIVGRDPARGAYIMYAYLGGGQGANWSGDGLNNGPTAIGVALTPQIENYEYAFPVRYHEYGLREDSGGLGEFRGGLGVVWDVELIRGEATMSAMADRASRGAAGIMGGLPGATNVYEIHRADGSLETLPHLTKCENFPLRTGDRVRRFSPGGGGLGDVDKRGPERREADLVEGYSSQEAYDRADELALDERREAS